VLSRFIASLPLGVVTVPETFAADVPLRNTLVHDVSRFKATDFNRLSFAAAKLKVLYALFDAIALGGELEEIIPRSEFLAKVP
jgi:hypothetical protein